MYKQMLDNWVTNLSSWISVMTAPRTTDPIEGLFDMLNMKSDSAVESIAACNIISAVLGLRYILFVRSLIFSLSVFAY